MRRDGSDLKKPVNAPMSEHIRIEVQPPKGESIVVELQLMNDPGLLFHHNPADQIGTICPTQSQLPPSVTEIIEVPGETPHLTGTAPDECKSWREEPPGGEAIEPRRGTTFDAATGKSRRPDADLLGEHQPVAALDPPVPLTVMPEVLDVGVGSLTPELDQHLALSASLIGAEHLPDQDEDLVAGHCVIKPRWSGRELARDCFVADRPV